MDIRKPSKVEMIVLTVVIVYLPYGWLLYYTGLDWHVIRIWPLLPGLAISEITKPLHSGHGLLDSLDGALIFTVLLLGLAILGVLRLQARFWTILSGFFVLSCALTFVIYALLRA